MRAEAFPLVNQTQRVYCNSESPGSTGAVLWTQPDNLPLWGSTHRAVQFGIRVTAVGGGPTTWSLAAKFQRLVMHTTGMHFEYPTWVDLDTDLVSSDIVEGLPWSLVKRAADTGADPADGGFGVIATDASALPVFKKRTLENFGLGCRIKLDPVSTGGTTPYLNLSIVATLLG